MARMMSFAMAVFILVPAVAPALGLFVLRAAGWRAIFVAFFLIAAAAFVWLLVRQPETLPPARRRSLSPRAVGRAVREIYSGFAPRSDIPSPPALRSRPSSPI